MAAQRGLKRHDCGACIHALENEWGQPPGLAPFYTYVPEYMTLTGGETW